MNLEINLKSVSDKELVDGVINLQGKERETTLKVMYHLIEIERRKLYRKEGFSSMFDYCTRKLKYSEGSAFRRITGARSILEYPELGNLFLEGKVSLCSISKAVKTFKAKELTPIEIVNKSAKEVEVMVSSFEPAIIKPKETIRSLVIQTKEMPLLPNVPKEERFSLKFTVTKEVYERFLDAKNNLSNSLGGNLSIEVVFERLVANYLKPKVRKPNLIDTNKRYIPRFLKQEIQKRDKDTCTFIAADGTRCCEKRYLQIDHIKPYALGGKTELSNLRLLCKAHNLHLAEVTFN